MKFTTLLAGAGAVVLAALSLSVVDAIPASAIIGGEESPQAYPFTGSLNRPADSPNPDGHVCGVTLIAPQWVVTAAHCARNAQEDQAGYPHGWTVRLGSVSKTSGGEVIPVQEYVRRANGPRYDHFAGRDIALLKLKTPAKAAPVKIAGTPPAPGTPALILGWGSTCATRAAATCYPGHLRQAQTQVQPDTSCAGTPPELCIGAPDGTVAPANLDSGGPALVKDGTDWTLAGLVSAGGDARPAIYTNVAAYRDWITETTTTRHPSLDGAARTDVCSGSIVRKSDAKPDDPALFLTNGHCVKGDRPAPGSAVTNRAEARDVTVLGPRGGPTASAHTTKLVYATMTGTDIALYQLDETYAQLAAGGAKVFDLATREPQQADQLVLLAGESGKTWACAVANIVPELREGGYSTHNAIQYNELCAPGSGDSGAPMVDPHTGEMIGIHATGNGAGGVCTEADPCEVDDAGVVTVHMGRSYGEQTAAIPACLAPGSTIDLGRAGCTLTKPAA